MKKIFNTIMLISLAVFSFYYTEKVALMMQEKDEIMLKILQNKDKYTVKSVNAFIDGDTIIPGVEGKTVNKASSYKKMKEANYYNESLFLYDYIKPDVSIVYNLDKVIIKGNKNKKAVALVIHNNESVKKYLLNMNYEIDYSDICLVNLKEDCSTYTYKVKPTLIMTNANFYQNIKKIESGFIIFIDSSMSIDNVKLIIDEVNFRNLKVVSLNHLIDEKND